jgi:hypothetical protein
MNRRKEAATSGSRGKVEPAEGGDDTERTILRVAPEQEAFDWICYLVRGGVAPDGDEATRRQEADERARRRPERRDIERVLGDLVSHGMLTCDDGRWSMTSKGHVRSRELGGAGGARTQSKGRPVEPGASPK